MRSWLRPGFLLVVAAPFVAKLIVNAGWAIGFVYETLPDSAREMFLIAGLLPIVMSIVFAIRYLFAGSLIKAAIVGVAIILALTLPRIKFGQEYLVFKTNEPGYLAAVEADASPSPKFKFFDMREVSGYPAGGDFYLVVYDETREIGLPEASRSSEWLSQHAGFTLNSVRGRANPHANIEVFPLEGDFFLVVERY
jgi:hypothetical protein